MEPTELLTAKELAERLRVTPDTVRAWSRRGLIPTLRLSPKVQRFDFAEVCDALRRNRGKGVADAR